jgi:hypothetical protein
VNFQGCDEVTDKTIQTLLRPIVNLKETTRKSIRVLKLTLTPKLTVETLQYVIYEKHFDLQVLYIDMSKEFKLNQRHYKIFDEFLGLIAKKLKNLKILTLPSSPCYPDTKVMLNYWLPFCHIHYKTVE